MPQSHYIGRFAPSPSGPLHLGSLVAALGSYLQARAQQGVWLVRIEDVDPPREMAGASELILKQLRHFGLHWDGEVRYQSQQSAHYEQQLALLQAKNLAYYCQCTRKQIQQIGGFYQGQCRQLQLKATNNALRLRCERGITHFNDRLHGTLHIPEALAHEDFIIKRRDGLYAYNLAVVLDDIDQGVTEVVRGADLIEPTGRQIYLYQLLGHQAPQYLHLPLLLDAQGNKLSKQNHAPALDWQAPQAQLLHALRTLGQAAPQAWLNLTCEALLARAVSQWNIAHIPHSR